MLVMPPSHFFLVSVILSFDFSVVCNIFVVSHEEVSEEVGMNFTQLEWESLSRQQVRLGFEV